MREYEDKCLCGKIIKGFSEHHAKQNLLIHKQISKEHKERINLLENISEEIVFFNRGDNIAEKLAKHPVMINDIKAIGKVIG